jgi:hypothetical protein
MGGAKGGLVWALLALAAGPGAVCAEEAGAAGGANGPVKGAWDLAIGLGGARFDDNGSGGWGGTVQIGYFSGELTEVGFRQTGLFASSDFDRGRAVGASRGFVALHLPIARDYGVYPYGGIIFGYIYGRDAPNSIAVGPEIGVKVFLGPRTYWHLGGEYQALPMEGSDLFANSALLYQTGIGWTF